MKLPVGVTSSFWKLWPRTAQLLSLYVNESRNSLHNDFCFWMTHTVSIGHPRYRNGYFLLSLHTKLLCRSRAFLSLPHWCPSEHQGRSSQPVALYFFSSVHFLFSASTWGMASPMLANPTSSASLCAALGKQHFSSRGNRRYKDLAPHSPILLFAP